MRLKSQNKRSYEDWLVVLDGVLEELEVAPVDFEDVELGAESGGLGVLADQIVLLFFPVARLLARALALRSVVEDVRVRVGGERFACVWRSRFRRVLHLSLQRVRLRALQHLLLVQLQDVVQIQLPRVEELHLSTSSRILYYISTNYTFRTNNR